MHINSIIDDSPEVHIAAVNDGADKNYEKLHQVEDKLKKIANRHRTQISGLLITPFLHGPQEAPELNIYGVHIHVIPRHSVLTSDSATMRRLHSEIEELFEAHQIDTQFSLALLTKQELPIHLKNPASETLLPAIEFPRIEEMLERSFSARQGAMVG